MNSNSYDQKIREIAEILARIGYNKSKFRMLSWEELTQGAKGELNDLVGK